MGVGPAVFQSAGQRSEHYIPGAYSRSAAIGGGGGLSAANGVILGKSNGGIPNKLYAFSTPAEAQEVLVDGELLKAVCHAFTPSPQYTPQTIYAMRVNPGTQSTRSLKSGSQTVLTLKSADYGVHMNQLKMQLENGTKSGTKKVVFMLKENTEKIDNIGKNSISIQYTGSGTAATLTVSKESLSVTVTGADDSITLAFEDFDTIETLVTRLNDTGVFAVIQLESESNVPSNELDAVTGLDIKTEAKTLTSNFYALLHALESSYYIGKGNVEKSSAGENSVPDNDAEFIYFEGAIAGAYTVSEWNDTLISLETEDVQMISTPSTDFAVHTLIANHCTQMSSVIHRKERTALVGGPIGQTIDEALEFASQLNNKLVSYVYPSITATSPITGEAEDLPASFMACKLLGMECAVAINEPLTWKTVSVVKFLVKLRTTEIEKLIIGGVLCCAKTDDKRLAVIRAMTTHQGNKLQEVERSMVREDLYMNRDIRHQYGTGVGRPGVSKGGDSKETLLGAAREWKAEGLIVPDDEGNNVWNIVVRKSGDKTYISFDRNLTTPDNFFFITANNYVYESKTTVEV